MTTDFSCDLKIKRLNSRLLSSGVWLEGTTSGFKFQALVFAEHATDESFELGQSRISKLWVRRERDKVCTFNFDRCFDIDAQDEETAALVEFLKEGLAELVFGK